MAGIPYDPEHEAWKGLHPLLRDRLLAAIQASGGKIYLVSGYRSKERQRQLWKDALAKYGDPEVADNYVANPDEGKGSNHMHGLAVDVGGDLEFLRKNGGMFGLTQPMSWEPWHWQLAGTDHDHASASTRPPMGVEIDDPERRKDMSYQLQSLAGVLDRDVAAQGYFGADVPDWTNPASRMPDLGEDPSADGDRAVPLAQGEVILDG